MYLLMCLALLGSTFGIPLADSDLRNDDLAARYVLPTTTFPTFYDVQLFIDPDNEAYFYGNVSIRIIPNVNTNEIVLHALELEIDDINVHSHRDEINLVNNYTIATDDTQLLRIYLTSVMDAFVPHIIEINYVAKYAANMFGVYVSRYQHPVNGAVNLVTSQLQPTFARRAFPCYDEPAQKAIFRTTIYAPEKYPVVRSNMPERNETLKEDVPGYVKHEFDDTVVMSTYLLAYLVSDFEYIHNDNNTIYEVPFRVYSRPGTQEHAEFALDFGQKNMIALENYTELDYALPKIDKVAVPDFAAGAMENWGLVIYREVALLVQEGVTTTSTKQNIGRIISHENTHMWFGNEVGPASWTYTWLNEGFANFFESYATDFVLPEWRMMDQFVLNLQNVFQSDAVLSVNSMTHPVYSPSQILGTFNAVAYQKSGSVIRMLQHILTPEVFQKGLALYIRTKSRGAATPPDLYAALQQALSESNHSIPYTVATIMDRWANQGGFPVLRVRRLAPSANSISISQERYLTDRGLFSNDRWHVPVNWVLSTDVDFSDTGPQAWVPPSFPAPAIDIPGLSEAEWFIVNKQQTGYYRVNYDNENWAALARVLNNSHEIIHVLNRAQIVDDAFNLARNGRLDYIYAFEISRYLVAESDYVPWAAVNAALNYLDIVLSGTSIYEYYQWYTLNLTAPLYNQLGFEATDTEEHVTAYHRNIILDLNCRNGNADCVNKAVDLIRQLRNNADFRINPDIQTTVFCSSLRGGDAENFDFLWARYVASTDSSEQSILLNSLGCTSNTGKRDFYLNQVIAEDSLVRDQDKHTVIVSVINASPENTESALDFVIEHFAEIQPRVQGLSGTTNILNAFSRRLSSEKHSEKVDEFVNRHQNIFTAGEIASLAAIRENIAASVEWNKQYLSTVDSWLRGNYGNNANILHSSLLIIISIFVVIYNNL